MGNGPISLIGTPVGGVIPGDLTIDGNLIVTGTTTSEGELFGQSDIDGSSAVGGTEFVAQGTPGANLHAATYEGIGPATGHPTTGTHSAWEVCIAQDGGIWLCTVGGSPGTWIECGGGTPTGLLTDYGQFTGAFGNPTTWTLEWGSYSVSPGLGGVDIDFPADSVSILSCDWGGFSSGQGIEGFDLLLRDANNGFIWEGGMEIDGSTGFKEASTGVRAIFDTVTTPAINPSPWHIVSSLSGSANPDKIIMSIMSFSHP